MTAKKEGPLKKRGPAKNVELDRRIGLGILRIRQRRGFTLQVLADRAGLHLNTVHRAEIGCGATAFTLCRIALALRSGLDALVPLSETFVNVEKLVLASTTKPDMIPFGTEKLFEDSGPVPGTTGEHYDSGQK